MGSVAWIEHKGQKILYGDYRGLTEKEINETLERAYAMTRESQGNIRGMINIQGEIPISLFMEQYKSTRRHKEVRMIAKLAIIGIESGVMDMLFQAVSANAGIAYRRFKTEEEAKDWLVG